MKMWKSDRYIYRMGDGTYKAQDTEPKPALAAELIVRAGGKIPASDAAKRGWIGFDKQKAKGK